ncbi:Alpha-1 6-mannosyl-glycoprotein 2-beta-N-acetylglucosaminyltransferase [Paragonimus heterotremus]|uniref:Alpha-1 6-mannosyl-glycoprotein 2-beta-N-acetylglucosaminyltransferase n=1 Tax=Paragonimus heterotremus TaxID=100268 RepID=A0A8J4X179_9TREM|nr:Alpha-1 6-mannosyl-glycoprotein 2-beta-N-acetylglucosaminyltransferase [Paragonimus heterotremus]
MGMGISRAMWRNLSSCLKLFCQFDDYNWDWSLYEVSTHCIPNHLKVLQFPSATRVYHLGSCNGLHHVNMNCSVQEQALILTQRLSGPVAGRLYPPVLNIKPLSTKRMLKFRANGGWADPRDHALCQSMANASWNSSLLLWAPQLTAHSPIY